jgi:hypothetical protein
MSQTTRPPTARPRLARRLKRTRGCPFPGGRCSCGRRPCKQRTSAPYALPTALHENRQPADRRHTYESQVFCRQQRLCLRSFRFPPRGRFVRAQSQALLRTTHWKTASSRMFSSSGDSEFIFREGRAATALPYGGERRGLEEIRPPGPRRRPPHESLESRVFHRRFFREPRELSSGLKRV